MKPRAEIGMCFPRTFPAAAVTDAARRLESGGADQIWIIEDCFYTAGVSLAAAAASVTDRLTVGLGILPAVVRNPAITAMEIATLCALAPGRVLPGLGHGVQSWMEQIGARPRSPLTALGEVFNVVRRLLAGERVTFHGEYVQLDGVQLDQPVGHPPLLAGVQGPKSMALAGRVADGLILAEPASPSYVRWAVSQAGHPDPFHVVTFSVLCVTDDRSVAHRIMTPWLASLLDGSNSSLTALPFYDELVARYSDGEAEALATMPTEWWVELGPIGTMDDAAAHIEALDASGVGSIGLFPSPDVEIGMGQIEDVLALAAR